MVGMCCPEAPVAAVLIRRKGVKYVARNPVAAALGMRHINERKCTCISIAMHAHTSNRGKNTQ